MDAVAHFTQLARYNVWATARLLDAVQALPEDDYRRDVGLFFKSIHGTLNHLLVGEHHAVVRRFAEGVSPTGGAGRRDWSPTASGWRTRLRAGAARWAPLIASLAARPLGRHAGLHHHAGHGGVAAVCGHAGPRVQPRHPPPGPDHGGIDRAGPACPELDFVYLPAANRVPSHEPEPVHRPKPALWRASRSRRPKFATPSTTK